MLDLKMIIIKRQNPETYQNFILLWEAQECRSASQEGVYKVEATTNHMPTSRGQ